MRSLSVTVVLTFGAAFFVLLAGCDGQQLAGQNNLQEPGISADEQPNQKSAKPIRWELGPTVAGDAVRNIVFREPSSSKARSGERRPKTVMPRPMIQGAPEALCIGEDGSQYVGGSFSGNKDFDTGPGFDFHESVGAEDGFVTRFDRDGKYCWTKTFGAKERVDVRGIAVSRGVVYAVCEELEGHVAIVAMDCATGASKAGFGHSGCQMFRCGQFDFAAGIRSRGDTIYVAIRCRNILAGKLPPLVAGEPAPAIAWPDYSFTVVLAIDGTNGSAVISFGTKGVQTIGNALALTGPPSAKVANTNVEPFGLAVSGSTLYVFGRCDGNSLGIGGQGSIIGERMRSKGFIAALNIQTGTAVSGFGQTGLVVMDRDAAEVADTVVSEGLLYVTGCWQHAGHDNAYLAAMDASTGRLSQQFGTAGMKVLGPWEWESGWSIRVKGQVAYITGGYMDRETEGVFVAAFDRTSGLPVKAFGSGGTQLIEGLKWGEQGRIEPFGNTLFLAARTEPSLEKKHEVKIGETIFTHDGVSGFLFRLRTDGRVVDK